MFAAVVVLVAALGGTVYAAGKINGHAIKVKSLPGNRLTPGSVPGNRLKRGTVPGNVLAPGSVGREQLAPGSISGLQIDLTTLGQVPSATSAEQAEAAQSADRAQTAVNAENAENAKTLNGHRAECDAGTRYFAGACWQTETNGAADTPVHAAANCKNQGGELPNPLLLAVFATEPGIVLASGDEWTNDIPILSGTDIYAVATVSSSGSISSGSANTTHKWRCVIPLLS
jgi:hypothetical protein